MCICEIPLALHEQADHTAVVDWVVSMRRSQLRGGAYILMAASAWPPMAASL